MSNIEIRSENMSVVRLGAPAPGDLAGQIMLTVAQILMAEHGFAVDQCVGLYNKVSDRIRQNNERFEIAAPAAVHTLVCLLAHSDPSVRREAATAILDRADVKTAVGGSGG